MWLVKTDANGVVLWHQIYRDPGLFEVTDIIQTADGGFALAGGLKTHHRANCFLCASGAWPDKDMLLLKTDANGVMTWKQSYGGPDVDNANALVQITDGEFVMAGFTASDMWLADSDIWLVKTDVNGLLLSPPPTTISSSTPTPGWGSVPLLVAFAVLATWHRRKPK